MSQPEVIDGLLFARGGSEIEGALLKERFLRLAEMACRVDRVEYVVRGGANDRGKPCLRIRASSVLELMCQRCLEPLAWPVAVDAELEVPARNESGRTSPFEALERLKTNRQQ